MSTKRFKVSNRMPYFGKDSVRRELKKFLVADMIEKEDYQIALLILLYMPTRGPLQYEETRNA